MLGTNADESTGAPGARGSPGGEAAGRLLARIYGPELHQGHSVPNRSTNVNLLTCQNLSARPVSPELLTNQGPEQSSPRPYPLGGQAAHSLRESVGAQAPAPQALPSQPWSLPPALSALRAPTRQRWGALPRHRASEPFSLLKELENSYFALSLSKSSKEKIRHFVN